MNVLEAKRLAEEYVEKKKSTLRKEYYLIVGDGEVLECDSYDVAMRRGADNYVFSTQIDRYGNAYAKLMN